ncbi:hypothetical protein B566_EDAN005398 [Ephemera danica]|nr:hypothetical protein B566_EDAN005398 [Ephemera danica]
MGTLWLWWTLDRPVQSLLSSRTMKLSQDLLTCRSSNQRSATFFWVLDARQASIACAVFQQGFDKREDFKIGIIANIVVICVKFIFHCLLIHAALTCRRHLLLPSLVLIPASLVYLAFKTIALLHMMDCPINDILVLVIFFAVLGFGGYAFLTVVSLYNQLGYQDHVAGDYNSLTPEPTAKIFRLATPPPVHLCLRDVSAIV